MLDAHAAAPNIAEKIRAAGEINVAAFDIAAQFVEQAKEIERLQSRVDELEAERQWKPIEAAPKDGTWVVIKQPGMGPVCVYWASGKWNNGGSGVYHGKRPTHWMPLPPEKPE